MTVFLIGIPSGYVVTRDTVEEMYARQTPYLRRIRFRGGTLITMWDMVSHWKHRIVIMPTLYPPTISVVIDNRESSWCQLSRHPWLQLSLKSDSQLCRHFLLRLSLKFGYRHDADSGVNRDTKGCLKTFGGAASYDQVGIKLICRNANFVVTGGTGKPILCE